MAASQMGLSAVQDLGLGLGDMLRGQTEQETEDEKRKRLLGLSTMGQNPLNFGMTGVASADLGLGRAGRR